MRVLMVNPGEKPREMEIANELKAMQQAVGGYIEIVHPFEDANVVLVCDEEGLLKASPFNRRINEDLWIFGPFFLCGEEGEEGEDLADLPPEMMDKYARLLGGD